MKRYNIIDLVDEREFRSEVMTDLPEQWDADLHYKDGSYYLNVSDVAEEPIERMLKANNIRFIRMNVEERELMASK